MGEAGTEVVAFVVDEDLRLVFESTKGGGVEDAIAVALEGRAIVGFVIEIGATFGVFAACAVGGETLVFVFFEMLTSEMHGWSFERLRHCEERTTVSDEAIS